MMRWLWRLFVIFVFVFLLKSTFAQQPQAFISWPASTNFGQKLQWELDKFQRLVQDLPASLEVEIHQLWQGAKPKGDSRSV